MINTFPCLSVFLCLCLSVFIQTLSCSNTSCASETPSSTSRIAHTLQRSKCIVGHRGGQGRLRERRMTCLQQSPTSQCSFLAFQYRLTASGQQSAVQWNHNAVTLTSKNLLQYDSEYRAEPHEPSSNELAPAWIDSTVSTATCRLFLSIVLIIMGCIGPLLSIALHRLCSRYTAIGMYRKKIMSHKDLVWRVDILIGLEFSLFFLLL